MHEHVKRMTAILRAFQTPTGRTEGSPLRDVTPLTPPEVLHGHADDKLSALQTTRNQEPLHIHPVLTSAAVCCTWKGECASCLIEAASVFLLCHSLL